MEYVFKIFEFNVYNGKNLDNDSDEDDEVKFKNTSKFIIQMFGINEEGKRASIIVEDYEPFFYLKVDSNWGQTKKTAFYNHLISKIGKYYENSIVKCKLIERKKLYGYDAGKKHRFIEMKFANINTYNKVKNLWYQDVINDDGEKERKLLTNGYKFISGGDPTFIELYEANIPPLLRFFHIRDVSPSGWIAMPIKKTTHVFSKTTSCDFEFVISYKNIIPLNNKEDCVPYKIMSFDIEASSSHGDFPVPIKSYKKLATNIVDYFVKLEDVNSKEKCKEILGKILSAAFGFTSMDNIDKVYPKEQLKDETDLLVRTENWFKTKVRDCKKDEEHLIEMLFENANKAMQIKDAEGTEKDKDAEGTEEDSDSDSDAECVEEEKTWKIGYKKVQGYKDVESTIVDIMCDKKFEREGKINELIRTLRNHFPALEGDKVTFIGSTFMNYGDKEPYLNHCIVLNSCDNLHEQVANSQIDTYNTEKEVLQAWTRLVQIENPDIIIGYNIFSFDYEFMFRRSQELYCVEDFLKLSRNNDELCVTVDYRNPEKLDIDRSSTTLASGTYELSIIKMNGRLQVDMLNWFRRTENLTSYKLDYVGGHFIGDDVKCLLHRCRDESDNEQVTRITTNNMTGLQVESYIHF